jgi:hypothetical protein
MPAIAGGGLVFEPILWRCAKETIMAKPLSVRQFAALALGQKQPPWHLGSLCGLYNVRPLSLKSSVEALSKATAVIYVQAGVLSDLEQLVGDEDPSSGGIVGIDESFNSYWTSDAVSNLQSLEQLLKACGVVISYFDPGEAGLEGSLIGLAGTYADLAALNVKELPGNPSTWTSSESATAKASSFLLNSLAGNSALVAFGQQQLDGLATNPNALPLAALFPGASSDTSSAGLLGVVGLNQGVNVTQVLITHYNKIHNVMRDVTYNLCCRPYLDGLDGANAAIKIFSDWITFLSTLAVTDLPPSIEISSPPGTPLFSISEIVYQIGDNSSGGTVSVSQFTVNPDGTSAGGVVS